MGCEHCTSIAASDTTGTSAGRTDDETTVRSSSLEELRSMDAEALLANVTRAVAEGSALDGALDFSAFVTIMTSQAVAEFAAPGSDRSTQRLKGAFDAIDTNGDGAISMDEMLSAVNSVCITLPTRNQAACDDSSLVAEAFGVFDADHTGAINYEEFVAMVSGRGIKSAVYDEFVSAADTSH